MGTAVSVELTANRSPIILAPFAEDRRDCFAYVAHVDGTVAMLLAVFSAPALKCTGARLL